MRKCDYLTQNENENRGIAITIQNPTRHLNKYRSAVST